MTDPQYRTIRVEALGRGVTRLTLARPEKNNALNAEMISDIEAALAAIETDATVSVLVIAAEGPSFCAGGDLAWMREQADRGRSERERAALGLAGMLARLDHLPKLVIGAIEGAAYGGGVGLAALCDVTLAAPGAKFALTETRLGLIPATISPFVIRRIGAANARRVMLNARPFDAVEARRMGLVSEVVAAGEMEAAIAREVDLASACFPGAVADTKALIHRLAVGEAPGASETAALLADRWETEEAATGLTAFLDRARQRTKN